MTGQRRRTLAAACRIALALIGLAGVLLAAGCGKRHVQTPAPPETSVPAESGPSAVKVTGGARIVIPENGPRVWVAEAETITASTEPGNMKLTKVSCQLYRNGQETLRVQADAGDAVQQGKTVHMTLTGNVRAVEPVRGLRLTADQFEWASQYDRVSAVNVHWIGLGFDHRADRGVFSTDLTRGDFSGHVKTTPAVSK